MMSCNSLRVGVGSSGAGRVSGRWGFPASECANRMIRLYDRRLFGK
jgi:hypothetical protein